MTKRTLVLDSTNVYQLATFGKDRYRLTAELRCYSILSVVALRISLRKSPAAASQISARFATLKTPCHESNPFVSDLRSLKIALLQLWLDSP